MGRIIEVVPHDATAWRAAFAREARALKHVFGEAVIAIHHVGSTSIPGLPAKPIIDLLVVLRETVTIGRFSSAMEALGYRVRGECLDAEVPGTPGRFYFSKDQDGRRTHHTHACAVGHVEIADKLAFRDYLRAHPRRAAVSSRQYRLHARQGPIHSHRSQACTAMVSRGTSGGCGRRLNSLDASGGSVFLNLLGAAEGV